MSDALHPQEILDLTRHACGAIDSVTDQTGSLANSIAAMRAHSARWTPALIEAALTLSASMEALAEALSNHAAALRAASTTRH
ncbi:hypothetical protein HKCCSP123_06160 [Rhodobacterales bacterium HKCCSP123]|nr:hypothetical protein [Rhodobacterales bacterium HKCCSP123]